MSARRRWPAPVTVVVLTLTLFPLVPLVVRAAGGRWSYPALVPRGATLRGIRLLTDPGTQVPRAALTSTLIAVTVAALAVLIGLPAGRALGLYRFRGRRVVQFLLLAPVIVPGLAVALGLQVFFVRYGLADTVTGVVLVQLVPTVPYAATVLASAFANLDPDYERQARALGAGPVRAFLLVTVPILRPALTLAAVFTFLISWSEYVLTLLIGGGRVQTLPLLLFATIGSSDTTAAAALALALVVPPLVLVLAVSRTATTSDAVVGLERL